MSYEATGYEALVLTPGSFVIERYTYKRQNGGEGVQWCVHRVESGGGLAQLTVCDTRKAAAQFVESLSREQAQGEKP